MNGYTAAIAGRYPKSWIKITLAVLAIMAVVILVLLLSNH